MSEVIVTESSLSDIADAIRAKNGTQNTYKPGQMAAAITALPTATIEPLSVTENGTYTAQSGGYSPVVVNVSGGGSLPKTGTFTPTERVTAIDVDIGLSDYNVILVIPESSTPFLSNGKTCISAYYTKNYYFNALINTTNNAGASPQSPVSTSISTAMASYSTGTTVTLKSTGTVDSGTLNGGYWDCLTYRWFAW